VTPPRQRGPASPKAPFDRWLALAEAQLEAARTADGAALLAATNARAALQIELASVSIAALDAETRAHAGVVARRIRSVDVRIHACGTTMLGLIERALPDAGPRTYGRRAQMRGV
jgi:hypothetical protein